MRQPRIPILLKLSAIAACPMLASACADSEREVDLADVPAAVVTAAESAKQGFVIESAELVRRDGGTFYEVEGRHTGTEIEMLVAPDGRIVDMDADD